MTDKPLSPVEKVKEESRGLRGDLAAQLSAGGDHFSEAGAQLLKFHGTYQQEDRDQRRALRGTDAEASHQFMGRCQIPGGALTGEQSLVIDDLADRYGNGTLRVTTRQGNQFHGVLKGDLKATIRSVNDVLVTTLGACGDVVRNVISCPAPLRGGLREEVLRVARQVSDHLLPRTRSYHEIWLDGEPVAGGPPGGEPDPIYGTRYLPRKFKVAFGFPDDNCCDVHSNDLGFLVVARGNRLAGFNVLVGGGMGRTHGKTDTYPRLADTLGFAKTGITVTATTGATRGSSTCSTSRDWTGFASRWSVSSVARSRRLHRSRCRTSRTISGGTSRERDVRSWACSSRTAASATTRTTACGAPCASWSRPLEGAFASRPSRTCC